MSSVVLQGNNEQIEENQEVKDNDQFGGTENCIFYIKIPQNESHLSDPSGHEIVFDVTFAIAVPGVFASTKPRGSFATRTSIMDHVSRNVQMFYHLEFDLFSRDIAKESFKTDIGFYGVYAKIYPDKSDSRIIPTWSDGEDTWVSWIQQYKIWMTDSHVKDLCSHKIKVMIWDSKDKCTPKVRFDRPKIPRSASRSKSENENVNWTKQTVLNISKEFSMTSEYKEENNRILPHEILTSQPIKINVDKNSPIFKSSQSISPAKSIGTSPNRKVKETELVESKKDKMSTLEKCLQLERAAEPQSALAQIETKSKYLNPPKIKSSIMDANLTKENSLNQNLDTNFKLEPRKSITLQINNEKEEKTAVTNIEINMAELFLKNYTLNRIRNSFVNLEDMFCKVSIEPEIISIEQRKRLNPLVIKIQKIDNFPIENEKVNEINKKYKPVYCEYKFSDFQRHQSLHRLHKKTMKFDDINILLMGEMSDIKIREQLLNSYFTVQIFHRIKQSGQENNEKAEINPFDAAKGESNIGDINLTNSYKMITSFPTTKHQGEAKIDLSDIVNKNLKFMEVNVSIVPTSLIGTKEENESRSNQVEEDQVNFLQAETSIKISFQLAAPLTQTLNSMDKKDYFTRIVVINNKISCEFIRETCANIILKYNCNKLNFLSEDTLEMKGFLYSIKNSFTDLNSVFAGFFLVDKECEVLFIEGKHDNMVILYNQFSSSLNSYLQDQHDTMSLRLLYNDSLLFQDRQDFQILTMIPQVLSKDISFFASQPLLYVRDILPKTCSEGICRLKALVMTDSMQVVVRNNLIPSPQMIQDLSQYLCSHINPIFESNSLNIDVKTKISLPKLSEKQIETVPVITNRKNIDQTNIIKTKLQQATNYVYASKDCEFSYSTQNKNAISSAMKELRNQMDPNRRYAFSQEYLFSGTVDPVDLDNVYISEENKLKSEYRWINKGHTSVIKDFSEVNNLSSSRIEDIKEQWKENELHSSFMKPTIPERDSRKFSFDLYIRPINLIERSSICVLSNYALLKEEKSHQNKTQQDLLENRTCTVDSRFKTHRLLPQTELTEKGRKSSNQISKLKGLRKDNLPVTNWVVKKYGDPNSISMISVLSNEPVKSQCFTVGPDSNRNLSVNYILINQKDPNFKSVYNPNQDSLIYKNPNAKVSCKNQFPFSMTC